jgi:DNA primase
LALDRASLTKQIREANDIVAVIGTYVSLRPSGNGHAHLGLCPFHNDHRPSFQVDSKFQNFRCWSCGKNGDVFTFIMERERVSFREARAILARRANIPLEQNDAESMARMRQLEAIRWAAQQYQQCLLEMPVGEAARAYLGERKLLGETVRKFGLGFAPIAGDWLVERASQCSVPIEVFEEVGLLGRSQSGRGWYDRFRDRVMFPIRNAQGQTVGFGGRILPSSTLLQREDRYVPKYYNSAETPIFSKSDQLYGLDFAKHAAATAGYMAVVEGYTDVMMAHQMGITQVVATMGTALNGRHVQQLRRYAPRVVLVFDADAGGSTGVDRALEIFASQNLDLRIATLPEGLDPCDLLVQHGAEPFKQALTQSVEALDFKLNQLLEREAGNGVEGQRRVIDAVLTVIAAAPDGADQTKHELMLTRIAQRLGIRVATVWERLAELRTNARRDADGQIPSHEEPESKRSGKAPAHECELLQLLLAHPNLVANAWERIKPEQMSHSGLRKLLEGLYTLQEHGQPPEIDELRLRMPAEDEGLLARAMDFMDVGRRSTFDALQWFERIVAAFDDVHRRAARQELKSQLTAASDHETEMDLLRRLQSQTVGTGRPGDRSSGEGGTGWN